MLIGLSGITGVGKSTVADYMVEVLEKNSKNTIIINMTDILKEVVSKLLSIDLNELERQKRSMDYKVTIANKKLTVRELYIEVDSILRNTLGDTVFIDGVYNKIQHNVTDNDTVVIIPDIRFYIEFLKLIFIAKIYNSYSAVCIKVTAELPSTKITTIDQEVHLIPPDYCIHNYENSDSYKSQVEYILEKLELI